MFRRSIAFLLAGALALSNPSPAYSQDDSEFVTKIAILQLEELLNMEVTSVLRKEQKLSRAPSAIFVITAEDIRRAGATSIPEALRLAPGVNVGRAFSGGWIISARGYDTLGATKMLVLIDGRTVYSPFFSGVFWDIQDVVLEDIERIEVIRGPGAVTWGENAVNGVVNIITKKSTDTQGLLVSAGGGKEEKVFATVRYGGKLSEDTTYRLYAKGFERDEFKLEDGREADDNWHQKRAGFRLDSALTPDSSFTFQGDIYDGEIYQQQGQFSSFSPPFQRVVRNRTSVEGGNLLARYITAPASNSEITAQVFYDYAGRSDIPSHENRNLLELDLQHHYTLSETHDFVYGLTYRFSSDDMGESLGVEWDPPERDDQFITVFFQDEISIASDTFSIIPGIKLGHNEYSGFEYQPALKFIWALAEQSTIWGSVSRAVRIPSRFNEDVRFISGGSEGPGGLPILPTVMGNRGFEAEDLLAYEIGFRASPMQDVSFDITTYYHRYDDLQSLEPGQPYLEDNFGPPHLVLPISFENNLDGDTYGVELAASWRPTDYMTLAATYTFTEVQFDLDPGVTDIGSVRTARRTPHNMASLRGHLNLPWDFEFDALMYYVDSAPAFNASSYIRTDLRLGYRATEQLTFDIIGQNIFDDRHRELGGNPPVEVERAIFGRVTYRFQ